MGAPPSHGDKRFPQTLESLLERVSTDHPHHTVAIILALANAKKDDEYLPNRGRAKGAGGRMSRGGAQDQLQDDDVSYVFCVFKMFTVSLKWEGRYFIINLHLGLQESLLHFI